MDLIEQEFDNDNNNSILRFLIKKLLPNKMSITQIGLYNTGVITLSDTDCLWIEKICRASLLVGNEYFSTLNTPLNFDLNYIQSYVIRTYLLLCHINYQHIIQKYQFYQPRKVNSLQTFNDDHETFELNENYSKPLEIECNYLNQLSTDKIYYGYNLLKEIATLIKEKQEDSSSLSLFEFIQSISDNELIISQLVQYEIKDFKLSHLNHIGKLYRTLIQNFEYPFLNVPDLLRTPINPILSNQLEQIFERELINIDYGDDLEKLQLKIEEMNQLLNDLKSIEDTLLQQSNQSLKQTCEHVDVKNNILNLIPEEIKCENYISLSIYLNQIQSILQERKINIEEKTNQLWNENFDSNQDEQHFKQNNRYRNRNYTKLNNYSRNISIYDQLDEEEIAPQYSSLFLLNINTIPITSFKNILRNNDQQITVKKIKKFVITHPDGKIQSFMWKIDNLYEELQKLFKDKSYDWNTYAIIDSNRISIDLTRNKTESTEYSIVQRDMLISILFHFQNQIFNYSTMKDCRFYSLIDHLNLESTPMNSFYYFHHETGQLIEDQTIGDLYQTNPILINIEQLHHTSTLFQITLRPSQGKSSIHISSTCEKKNWNFVGGEKSNIFHPMTTWKQIELWRQIIFPEMESSCVLWDKDNQRIIDPNQSISSSRTFDGISRNEILNLTFSFGSMTQHIQTLKSINIQYLFQSEQFFDFNLIISLKDCSLILDENNDQIISPNDFQKPLKSFCSNDCQTIDFQILYPINIQQQNKIFLKDTLTTIEQLIQQIDTPNNDQRYLTSNDTHRIYRNDENVIKLNIQNFLLVKENETSIVSIRIDENQIIQQRFTKSATIAEICKENSIDSLHKQLLLENDFVPSDTTSISCLPSPIEFQLIDIHFTTSVTIYNIEDNNRSLSFHCLSSMNIERILQISSEFFHIKKPNYCLQYNQSKLSGEILLDDIDTKQRQFHFQLISTSTMKCSISYSNRMIILPCDQQTQMTDLINDLFHHLQMDNEEMNFYELFLMNDEERSQVGLDLTIGDLLEILPSEQMTLKFYLEKKI